MNAARAGNVTIANAVGNGVADDKLIYTYLPDLIRYYLSEEPVLANVDTWRLGEPAHREEVLDRLDELVLKPVDGSGGKGIVIGPAASRAELDVLRRKVLADPRAWIAQPVVQLSTVPTLFDDRMRPRHVDLRPFAVNDGYEGVGAARRADPGRAGRGRADRELLARRRLQGHLGARRRPGGRPGARPRPRPRCTPRRWTPARRSSPARCRPSSSSRPGPRRRRAEPDRGVDVLDRPLRRAGRGHRPDPRRADPDHGRGPLGRHRHRLPHPARRHGHRDPRRAADPGVRALPAGLRHRRGYVDLVGHRRRAGERPSCPRDAVDRPVGGHQLDLPDRRVGPVPGDAHARTRSGGCASGPR